MPPKPLCVAALQFAATPFDLTRNLETARRLVRQAAAGGARLVVLPEMFNTGYVYTPRLGAFAETEQGLTLRVLRDLSAELGVCLAGSLLLRQGGQVYNTLALVQPGGRLHCYHKQHPFLWERCYFAPGQGPLVVETEFGRLGCLLGWDLAHPAAWDAYAGRVDLLVAASAPPRLHRAVLNFPLGRKVYLAQLLPGLLRQRDALDGLYQAGVAQRAVALGVPVAHAVLSGRFVTELPLARLSLLAAAGARPRYWPLLRQARLASLRATFYAATAIYSAAGAALAQVEGDEGLALAEVEFGAAGPAPATAAPPTPIPAAVRRFERLLRPFAARYYREHLI